MSRLFGLLLTALVLLVPAEGQARVVVLGIDGLDPDVVALLESEGKLPHLARLRKEGAFGRLRSMEPILSPILWTTIATGKRPSEHGIGDFAVINEKTGERLPVTSQMRRVAALWNILSDAGRSVAVVGWWATWPAEAVNGVVVSDHTCYHFLFERGLERTGRENEPALVYPPDRVAEIGALVRGPEDVRAEEIAPFVTLADGEPTQRRFDFRDELSHFKWAWATAETYRRIGLHLWKKDRPDLLLVYLEGVDSSSHLFGHLFRAEGLGGELAAQQARFGQTVEQMYLYADRVVGDYVEALGEDDTLVVLSDHGFALGALHADPSRTRDLRRVSAKFHREHGVLFLYGKNVKPGAEIRGATLLDVAPTLLALEGIAPARDMPGRVLVDALTIADPERTVETFESGDRRPGQPVHDASVDPAILRRLEALGYLDAQSPRAERNLAATAFEEGRYEEAVARFRAELEKNPGDPGLLSSLAGALGALGRYEEALEHVEEAIRRSPLHAGAYHNRGVIYERLGKRDEAIESYRKAVRFGSGYSPSREALIRLTGSAAVETPKTEEQKLAADLARKASVAARKGRYEEAMALLDRAERVAPDYVVVHQYRSNVAFLMGDTAAAKAALEKALALEPDNPLFKRNLESLSEPQRAH